MGIDYGLVEARSYCVGAPSSVSAVTGMKIKRKGLFVFIKPIEPQHNLHSRQRRITNMNSSTEDKAKGTAKEAIGTVKEKAGQVVGNPDLEARGTAEKVEGKVQQKVGDVKKVFEK